LELCGQLADQQLCPVKVRACNRRKATQDTRICSSTHPGHSCSTHCRTWNNCRCWSGADALESRNWADKQVQGVTESLALRTLAIRASDEGGRRSIEHEGMSLKRSALVTWGILPLTAKTLDMTVTCVRPQGRKSDCRCTVAPNPIIHPMRVQCRLQSQVPRVVPPLAGKDMNLWNQNTSTPLADDIYMDGSLSAAREFSSG